MVDGRPRPSFMFSGAIWSNYEEAVLESAKLVKDKVGSTQRRTAEASMFHDRVP